MIEENSQRIVDLTRRQLAAIPEEIFTQIVSTTTEQLYLDQNHFTDLPIGLTRLPHLKKLSAYHNKLTDLPEWLFDMNILEAINVSGNKITTFSHHISKLENLVNWDIQHNHLTDLPDTLGTL